MPNARKSICCSLICKIRCLLYFQHQFVLHDGSNIYLCLITYRLITLMHFMRVLVKIQIFVCQFHAREKKKRNMLFESLHRLLQQSWFFCSSLVLWLSVEGKDKEVRLSIFFGSVIVITIHWSEVVYRRCSTQFQVVVFFLWYAKAI